MPGDEQGSISERELGQDGQGVEDGGGGVDVAVRAHARWAWRRSLLCGDVGWHDGERVG